MLEKLRDLKENVFGKGKGGGGGTIYKWPPISLSIKGARII